MKTKIVIDGLPLLSPLTGIGRYTYEIAKEIKVDNSFDTNFYYGYYSKKLITSTKKSNLKHIKYFITKNQRLKQIIRKYLEYSSKVNNKKFDLYWQPNFIPLENIKAKKIITSVHDFSFILYRDFHPKERIEYFEKKFFKNISKSDVIITGSYYTKNEILERINISEDRVKVIYHGVNHNLFKIYDNLEISINLPKKFIFCAGSLEPRKNLISLLKAYNKLDKKIKKEYNLVLSGAIGWNNKEILQIIEENKKYIHYTGYVSDIELAKIYNLATIFVYPSLYEGFGLPPLEAMACSTPVITSNISSIPEVCQDAVLYCNPKSIDDIKDKMELLLNDINLQKKLIQKGLLKSKKFNWKTSANSHKKIFRDFI